MKPAIASCLRRVAGLVWLATWIAVLAGLLHVWSILGGIVDERLRWWARLGLLASPGFGGYAGVYARDLAAWGRGTSHARLLRRFWTPAAALTAVVLAVADADVARTLLGAFLGYWAGFDVAIGAWPLIGGRPYRFTRDIPPEPQRRRARLDRGLDRWT